MSMRKEFREFGSSLLAMLTLIAVCGLLYPLVVTGVGQLAFPGNANGQKVYVHDRLVGSKIIGQSFRNYPRYFQTRPSGTTPADSAAATSFANYGPNSKVTLAALRTNIRSYIALNGRYYPGGLTAARVPVDAADTSASGVDPDISVANARIQAYRVASVRHLARSTVDALIARDTAERGLGFSGEPGVNVLELNVALDRL
jgi:potassium-transporting ATPase KdpC subunit